MPSSCGGVIFLRLVWGMPEDGPVRLERWNSSGGIGCWYLAIFIMERELGGSVDIICVISGGFNGNGIYLLFPFLETAEVESSAQYFND